jgi:uncharacterized protein YabN with tetrapyrrole methylase and pyrophosphatase domain
MDKTSLIKLVEKQETECQEFGFYWESIDQLIEQIISECREIKEAHEKNDKVHLQEEVGDLLQAAVSLAVFLKLDPEETLAKSIKKFQKRFDALVEFAKQDGHATLENQPLEVLMKYWHQAKIYRT